eukprot:SAG31_NODE_586_length_13839_cov_22.698544_15_plen_81_part_00
MVSTYSRDRDTGTGCSSSSSCCWLLVLWSQGRTISNRDGFRFRSVCVCVCVCVGGVATNNGVPSLVMGPTNHVYKLRVPV